MNYYVFKISHDSNEILNYLIKEIKEGRLRQGWGMAGLDITNGYEEFSKQYLKIEPNRTDSDNWKDFKQLRKMLDIQTGDLIVVPKVSLTSDEDINHKFAILEAIGEYSFTNTDPFGDYGHTIPVRVIGTCHYDFDANTTYIASKFGFPYQSRVNRIWNKDVQNAICNLVKCINNNEANTEKSKNNILDRIIESAKENKSELCNKISETLTRMKNHQFEDLISELFCRNGYEIIDNNIFNGKGADIDIEFQLVHDKTLVSSMYEKNQNDDYLKAPTIRVQAKKKTGIDENDDIAVQQLLLSESFDNNINVVISTADKFTEKTIKIAKEKKVILINRSMLSELLLEYGKIFVDYE